jgi:hypothetical protein
MKSTILACIFLLVASAFGQAWVFEQVDTSASNGPTLARMPDGMLCVSYLTTDSVVRVAFKDTTWQYESVGSAVRTSPKIAVGPHGTVGVVYDSGGICYAERVDTGWAITHVPMAGSATGLAYDTAGVPLVTSVLASWNVDVFASTRVDTGWLGAHLYHSSPAYVEAAGSGVRPRFTSDNRAYVFAAYYWAFNIPIWGAGLLLFEGHGDSWQTVWDLGLPHYEAAAALALDSADVPAWCYNDDGNLLVSGQPVDSGVGSASMQFDSFNRLQIAYVRSGMLILAYRDQRGWLSSDVGVGGVTDVDLVLDSDMQPIIAYRTSAGVFLARGVDVVGTEETAGGEFRMPNGGATVLRGAAGLKLDASGEFYDAAGRRVTEPKAGVYFLREPVAGSSEQYRVRKVIVTR